MKIVDNDLLAMQEARILIENAREAQKELRLFSQQQIDDCLYEMFRELEKNIEEFTSKNYEETEIGNLYDTNIKIKLFLSQLEKSIKDLKCVGVISEDREKRTKDIGVPLGVIVMFTSDTNIVLTLLYKTILAIKSGNAIVFGSQIKAKNTMKLVMNKILEIAKKVGLPQGIIGYLNRGSINGNKELIEHEDTSLIINTGMEELIEIIKNSGKPFIYGSNGDSPVFIERTANIEKAVKQIVKSKTFDNGIVPGSEETLVVEKEIFEDVKKEFIKNGAYFLDEEQTKQLKQVIFDKFGHFNRKFIGKSAEFLAQKAGLIVEPNTKLLITKEKYMTLDGEYSQEKLCPLLDLYIEEGWENACEKCIELLLNQRQGHTLIIHSNDEKVIEQFTLKKPVGRILINTGGAFGSLGLTTNLFPAVTLGSGILGKGIVSCNVSPQNLIYIRKVGYEVRTMEDIIEKIDTHKIDVLEEKLKEILRTLIQ